MAEFYISLSKQEISAQIADMINRYNRWNKVFSADYILNTGSKYFIELDINKVVGCAAYIEEYPTLSKIHHVCILPQYRQMGIGKKLVALTIEKCNTEYVYMTVREDNIPSINLAISLNFRYVKKDWFIDHWTIIFGRRKDNVPPSTN
jgi:ribosomal protein S18 acetylase RimI-like enzyme